MAAVIAVVAVQGGTETPLCLGAASSVCTRLQGNRRRESGLAQLTFDLITDVMASCRRTPAHFITRVLQPHLPAEAYPHIRATAVAAAWASESVGISQMV